MGNDQVVRGLLDKGADVAARNNNGYPPVSIIYDEYAGSTKIAAHLDHISRCKTASGTNWSNRWTYLGFRVERVITSSTPDCTSGLGEASTWVCVGYRV